jgi:3-deoxy-D-manno-octulosonate 8-phosphate phosphatase (KDO 8-P phosphatase)
MSNGARTLAERCRAIEMLILDVDGVLTDGSIVYAHPDAELKNYYVRDGWGLGAWRVCGKQTALLTGRDSPVVARRAAELKIGNVVQGAIDKWSSYQDLLARTGFRAEQTCCIGDDISEIPLLRDCGLGVAVADAVPDLRVEAHYITRRPGGRACVREVIELILRCQGHWQTMLGRLQQQRA